MAQHIRVSYMPSHGGKKSMNDPIKGKKLFKLPPNSDGIWPEEIKVLKDIETGKKKLVVHDAEDFLKELDEIINAKS